MDYKKLLKNVISINNNSNIVYNIKIETNTYKILIIINMILL